MLVARCVRSQMTSATGSTPTCRPLPVEIPVVDLERWEALYRGIPIRAPRPNGPG
jgi:hypothetical protein